MQKRILVVILLFFMAMTAHANKSPTHAEGLYEELVQISIDGGYQSGVFSRHKDQLKPTRLIVLFPGYPSVLRPVVQNNLMINSRLSGNFLVRARRHLVDNEVATLLVDCHSIHETTCHSQYQASEARYYHVKALINDVRIKFPSIQRVYLMSTSMGSISSAFVAKYGQDEFSGVIHTSAIDPTQVKSYPELKDFVYSDIKVPQVFIHHIEDPCAITQYSYIHAISKKYKVPLITVSGGSGFFGEACKAHTQHGFKGVEINVMKHVLKMIHSEKWISNKLE